MFGCELGTAVVFWQCLAQQSKLDVHVSRLSKATSAQIHVVIVTRGLKGVRVTPAHGLPTAWHSCNSMTICVHGVQKEADYKRTRFGVI